MLWAGGIGGFVPLLFAFVTGLIALSAWSRARVLSAEVWKRRGLRPGTILLCGIAQRLDESGEPSASLVELEIEQVGIQRPKTQVVWKEISRVLRDRPFLIRTDAGDE